MNLITADYQEELRNKYYVGHDIHENIVTHLFSVNCKPNDFEVHYKFILLFTELHREKVINKYLLDKFDVIPTHIYNSDKEVFYKISHFSLNEIFTSEKSIIVHYNTNYSANLEAIQKQWKLISVDVGI